jgi:hypothetical protein
LRAAVLRERAVVVRRAVPVRLRVEDEAPRARGLAALFLFVVVAFRARPVPLLLEDEPVLRTAWVKLFRAFLKCV